MKTKTLPDLVCLQGKTDEMIVDYFESLYSFYLMRDSFFKEQYEDLKPVAKKSFRIFLLDKNTKDSIKCYSLLPK